MRRWPFIITGLMCMVLGLMRQFSFPLDQAEQGRVWMDPTAAILFVGFLICMAVAVSIKDEQPKGTNTNG